MIARACAFAHESHEGQTRYSGEPYIIHPLHVAATLARMGMDHETIAAGLLHDVLEDCDVTSSSLEEQFGSMITHLVVGVTNLGHYTLSRPEENQIRSFRRMILTMGENPRVIFVKLADRLHNMQTIEGLPKERRIRFAEESLHVYAPIAHNLGMWEMMARIEDFAFAVLEPDENAHLLKKLAAIKTKMEKFMNRTRRKLMRKLAEEGVEAIVQARMKHLTSIHRKMEQKGHDFDRLYDLMAFRIITGTEAACYEALSVCHRAWRLVPGRLKDYIAHPKSNAYRSLHTTLLSEEGLAFEVQIRTRAMHRLAEEGVAAHFTYKEGSDETMEALVHNLKESLENLSSMEEVRKVLSPDEIYVLTPKGDLYSFPPGSTVLDFAYRIHTEVGHHTRGAQVNGRIVPLETQLNTGDRVSIQTHPRQHPSRDWIGIVRTPSARAKIRRHLYRKEREDALEVGRRNIEDHLAQQGETVKGVARRRNFGSLLRSRGWSRMDDLFIAVGLGRVKPDQLFPEVKRVTIEEEVQTTPSVTNPDASQLVIGGESGVAVRFARCCYPLPGEAVEAAVTHSKGIVLHRLQCPLLKGKRTLAAHWGREQHGKFPALTHLIIRDDPKIKAEISKACSSVGATIAETRVKPLGQGRSHIAILIMVKDADLYLTLTGYLKSHPGILEVSRAGEQREGVRL